MATSQSSSKYLQTNKALVLVFSEFLLRSPPYTLYMFPQYHYVIYHN